MGQFNPVSRAFASFERIPLLPEQWTGWRNVMAITARRLSVRLMGVSLMVFAMGCAISLLTYDANDPSWNNASAEQIRNALGAWGATTADLLFQSVGVTSIIAIMMRCPMPPETSCG